MYVRTRSPKYFYRKCCNKVSINDLETIVNRHNILIPPYF